MRTASRRKDKVHYNYFDSSEYDLIAVYLAGENRMVIVDAKLSGRSELYIPVMEDEPDRLAGPLC